MFINLIYVSKLTYAYFPATCALLEDFEIFDNFDHIFKAFSTPKSGYDPDWTKNLKCKYKYLTNRTQLSKKQWGWQLLWIYFSA